MQNARHSHRRLRRIRSSLTPLAAILALLLQLVATAGHFHAEDFGGGAAKLAFAVGAPSAPAPSDPTLPRHDDCQLCASLQSASASDLARPPTLPLPGEAAGVALVGGTLLRLAPPAHLLFQTRAPPSL